MGTVYIEVKQVSCMKYCKSHDSTYIKNSYEISLTDREDESYVEISQSEYDGISDGYENVKNTLNKCLDILVEDEKAKQIILNIVEYQDSILFCDRFFEEISQSVKNALKE